jgi:hypothetical protein
MPNRHRYADTDRYAEINRYAETNRYVNKTKRLKIKMQLKTIAWQCRTA